MPYAFVERLKRGALAQAEIVEASDLVDAVRAIKSPEEIDRMRRSAAMQDAMMKAAFEAVVPGRRDMEVMAAAELVGRSLGSEQGWYMCASGEPGTAAVMAPPHLQNHVIKPGDEFTLLVENSGPGGYYTELGRTCVLGRASQELKDEFAIVLEARAHTLALLKPGASCKEIWEKHNDFMRRRQRPEEARLYCHSQGYDMVERPLVRFDETMTIEKNMVLACHPTYVTARTYSWACDNYLIGENGPERIHAFPEVITEIN
jgi:Xaa-Pro aminopeptidase